MRLRDRATFRRAVRSVLLCSRVRLDADDDDGELGESLFVELLARGHAATMTADGTSMFPAIWPGQRVRIEPAPFDDPPLSVGDVVLVDYPAGLVLHRIIARSGTEVLVKGDTLRRADLWSLREAILGRVVSEGLPHVAGGKLSGRLWASVSWLHWRLHGSRLFDGSSDHVQPRVGRP